MNDTINTFFGQPPEQTRPFSGQLEPSFQKMLAAEYADVTEEDCHFYHYLDLGNGKVIPGGWDIRGNENNYQGHINYDGLRVIEFGPASGYLSFWMESQGAEVVSVDLPPNHPPNLVPLPGIDLQKNAASGAVTATEVRSSWWFAHKARGSKAKAIYADIYRLPDDIGRFDVSTFGSILLHLGNPFKAMHEAARVTDKAMVVTDIVPEIIFGNEKNSFVEFNPGEEGENLVNWWACSPGAITKMLHVLGFPHVDVHYFENTYYPHHDTKAEASSRFMFTAVGQREAGMLKRTEKTPEEVAKDKSVRELVPVINVENYNDAHRRLQEAHAELEKIYSSFAWKLSKPLRMIMGK